MVFLGISVASRIDIHNSFEGLSWFELGWSELRRRVGRGRAAVSNGVTKPVRRRRTGFFRFVGYHGIAIRSISSAIVARRRASSWLLMLLNQFANRRTEAAVSTTSLSSSRAVSCADSG